MKNILLFIMLLFITIACEDYNKDIDIKIKTPSFDFHDFDDAETMKVTTGKENFWRSEKNRNNLKIDTKTATYTSKKISMPTISEEEGNVQMVFEVVKDDLVVGRGITSVIDITKPQDKYTAFITPIDKIIEVTPEELESRDFLKLYGFTLTRLPSGKLLVWGGEVDGDIKNGVFLYTPETAILDKLTLPNVVKRVHHSATLFYKDKARKHPRVLISGGIGEGHAYLDSVVIFNPETNKIESKSKMSVARAYHTSVTGSQFSYVIGGKSDDATYLKTIETFNATKNAFSYINKLDAPLEFEHGLANAAATYIGYSKKIIIAGGNGMDEVYGDMYELSTNGWQLTLLSTSQITPRTKMTPIFDGLNLYYVGGFGTVANGEVATPLSSIDKFEPISGNLMTKKYCQNLSIKGDATASLSINNKLVALSGEVGLTSGNIIDLSTLNCESKLVSSKSGREGGRAVLTKTGQVVIIGGKGSTTAVEILATSY